MLVTRDNWRTQMPMPFTGERLRWVRDGDLRRQFENLEAFTKGIFTDFASRIFRPLYNCFGFAKGRHAATCTGIALLLFCVLKFTIAGFVVSVVIDSADGKATPVTANLNRPESKYPEIVLPFCADCNSAPTPSWIVLAGSVQAAISHTLPGSIQRIVPHPTLLTYIASRGIFEALYLGHDSLYNEGGNREP